MFHENIQMVYSSNLLRAVRTAQVANLHWNVEHTIRPELGKVSFGHIEGVDDRDIAMKYRDFKTQQALTEEDLPYPGGECAGSVVRRAQSMFRGVAESDYERVVVVTHGGVIHSMTAHYLGVPMNKWRILEKSLENCGITELNWDEASGRFTPERFNNYAHLEPYPELLRKEQVSAENQECIRIPVWFQGQCL